MATRPRSALRVLALSLAVALLVQAALAGLAAAQPEATPAPDGATPTTDGGFFDPNPVAATPRADGPGRAVPLLPADHVAPDEPHLPYNSSPPTSGPHWPVWAEWGVYDEPLPDELLVHNLEHGGVVLHYRCDCPEAIAVLERFADPATGYPVLVIAAPNPDMEAEVAFTAWGRIQHLPAARVTPDVVRAFVEAYADQGPEKIHTEELAAWRASDAPKP